MEVFRLFMNSMKCKLRFGYRWFKS